MRYTEPYNIINEGEVNGIPLRFIEKEGSLYLWILNEVYDDLALFFTIWNTSKDIREDLLPEIEEILSKQKQWENIDAEVVSAYVQEDVTELWGDDSEKNLKMSTRDFKEITLKWLEFLERQGR